MESMLQKLHWQESTSAYLIPVCLEARANTPLSANPIKPNDQYVHYVGFDVLIQHTSALGNPVLPVRELQNNDSDAIYALTDART